MLQKILVPTDFSEASKAALLYAEELALLTKASGLDHSFVARWLC